MLFGPEYWLNAGKEKEPVAFIDAFIADPSICRLYLGLSKLDRETAEQRNKKRKFLERFVVTSQDLIKA